ncbi:MAG TPA: sugar ABC transporter permease [Caldilineaceae bacterium]|nr:sugar ABC transporter permease [Caldilineaceae bacterium]
MRKRSLQERLWRGRIAYLMLLPTFVLLFVFLYYPAFMGLYRSLFKWSAGAEAKFIGLDNFVALFSKDKVFMASLGHMVQLAAWYLFSTLAISLAMAVLLHRLRRLGLKYFFRLLTVLPVVIPAIVILMLWKFIYDASIGPLNALLITVGLDEWTRAWLSDPNTALYAVMLRNFPWTDGVATLILLAGFQAIPTEVVESSMIDGAGGLRRFWSIELPLVAGQIRLVTVLTIIWSIQEFTAIFALTQGGPINSTMVPGMWMYWNAFSINKMGYASAIGVVMFAITMILTVINMRYITTQDN